MKDLKNLVIAAFAVTGILFAANAYAVGAPDSSCNGAAAPQERHKKMEQKRQKMWDELNLTADQKKQLEANKTKNREGMKASFEKMKSCRESLKQELMKPDLDMGKISAIQSEIKALEAQMTDAHLNSVLEVRKILTHEQFEKFISLAGEHKRWQGKGQ